MTNIHKSHLLLAAFLINDANIFCIHISSISAIPNINAYYYFICAILPSYNILTILENLDGDAEINKLWDAITGS
jgi:hypothetical protein